MNPVVRTLAWCLPLMFLGVLGAQFTWSKLDQMEQIRGFKPADARKLVVLETRVSDGVCWIRWNEDGEISMPGPHRFDLPASGCDRYQAGDLIDVVFFSDDPEPYPRESVFADDGNFAFDRMLLVIELGLIFVPGVLIEVSRRRAAWARGE